MQDGEASASRRKLVEYLQYGEGEAATVGIATALVQRGGGLEGPWAVLDVEC